MTLHAISSPRGPTWGPRGDGGGVEVLGAAMDGDPQLAQQLADYATRSGSPTVADGESQDPVQLAAGKSWKIDMC